MGATAIGRALNQRPRPCPGVDLAQRVLRRHIYSAALASARLGGGTITETRGEVCHGRPPGVNPRPGNAVRGANRRNFGRSRFPLISQLHPASNSGKREKRSITLRKYKKETSRTGAPPSHHTPMHTPPARHFPRRLTPPANHTLAPPVTSVRENTCEPITRAGNHVGRNAGGVTCGRRFKRLAGDVSDTPAHIAFWDSVWPMV